MPPSEPQVARCEDYDSEVSSVKPGTRKEARRRATAPPKSITRYRFGQRDAASDSGYSSHSGEQASNTSPGVHPAAVVQQPARPATAHGQPKSRPVVHHRSQSQQSQSSQQKAPTRSSSTSGRQSSQCDNPNCGHPTCQSASFAKRRQSMSHQQYQAQQSTQYPSSSTQYPMQVPQYQVPYTQPPQVAAAQVAPATSAQARPRATSNSRQPRPNSVHVTAFPTSYNAAQYGPPPSSSAYQHIEDQRRAAALAQWYQQQAYQQAAAAYGTTPPTQTMPYYPQSPLQTSPVLPSYPTASGLQRNNSFSARMTNPATAMYDAYKTQPPLARTRSQSTQLPSARQSTMPGSFPGGEPESSETESSSEESSSEESEDETERARRAHAQRARQASSSLRRRPSIKRSNTTAPIIPQQRTSRDIYHYDPRLEQSVEYISSDNMDSDRTARAVIDRPRSSYHPSRDSSRRQSMSSKASSGRTKATSVSGAASGMASLVLEGRNGRNITYLSKRDQAALAEQYFRQQAEDQRRREDDIEAYQNRVRGPSTPELTAENIRKQQHRTSGSHVSGHSRKSSSSSKPHDSDGIKIESGGTVLHVYGNSKIEMRPSEDGGPAQFVVISNSGGNSKDSAYHSSSKSSSSRIGRSRGGSDISSRRRETMIREEEGYEQPTI